MSVMAQDLDSVDTDEDVIEEVDVIGSGEIEITNETEVSSELGEEFEEVEEEFEEIEEEGGIIGITYVTHAEGFVIKDDESNAEFFRGFMVVKKFIEKTEEIEDVEKKEIKSKNVGNIVLGVANTKEKFKIKMKEFNESFVNFDLTDEAGNIVGSAELKPRRYERVTLWFGNLKINSGMYAGDWSINSVAKTKVIKPKIEKPAFWNPFAFGRRKEAAIEEKVEERMFEREGMEEFVQKYKGKNVEEINAEERRFILNKERKFEGKVKDEWMKERKEEFKNQEENWEIKKSELEEEFNRRKEELKTSWKDERVKLSEREEGVKLKNVERTKIKREYVKNNDLKEIKSKTLISFS
jgi:hypothetical protein